MTTQRDVVLEFAEISKRNNQIAFLTFLFISIPVLLTPQLSVILRCVFVLANWAVICSVRRFQYRNQIVLYATEAANSSPFSKNSPMDLTTASEVMRLTDSLEFPFLLTKSIEMGLFKTYSSPATSKLLCSTKQMTTYCAKRYDDTDLLIREFTENKYGTDRAEKAIERMNFLHSSYVIDNEEYLYNLGIFMCFPPEMINKIGYRKLEKVEIEARYIKWCEIGRRMNLKDIPESFEAMQKFMEDFEERNFEYSKFNEQIMLATTGLFLAKFPTFVHPFLRQVTSAMCTPLMRKSLGMAEPMYGMTFAVESLMKGVGLFTRYFVLPRSEPYRRTQIHGGSSDTLKCVYHTFEETYKDGYVIGELGPLKFKKL